MKEKETRILCYTGPPHLKLQCVETWNCLLYEGNSTKSLLHSNVPVWFSILICVNLINGVATFETVQGQVTIMLGTDTPIASVLVKSLL